MHHLPSPSCHSEFKLKYLCACPGSRIHPLPSTAISYLSSLLQEGNDIRFGDWTQHDINWLNQVQARLPVGCCVCVWVGLRCCRAELGCCCVSEAAF